MEEADSLKGKDVLVLGALFIIIDYVLALSHPVKIVRQVQINKPHLNVHFVLQRVTNMERRLILEVKLLA